MKRLTREFFEGPTVEVSQNLIGKAIIFGSNLGIITETEAYIGYGDDPACHAHRGKTKRTEVLFGPAGFSYVYFIYGMYYCLNVVTEEEGKPAAVLFRGVKLITPPEVNLNGPGKLCKFLGINLEHNKLDLIGSSHFYFADSELSLPYKATPRIGISKALDKPWRFVAEQTDICTNKVKSLAHSFLNDSIKAN
jgi:DNA-3-methyladenine glycosylase